MSIDDKVKKISRKNLEQLALDLTFILYGETDENDRWVLNPNKEWDVDMIEGADRALRTRAPSIVPKKRSRP